jgi:glycosyltransferase involved in cell wall biosynthesis
MKLALVVQRYGEEIVGGAELHARWIAERLNEAHDLEVLTTCAVDYLTWDNALDPGEATVRGVRVRRFPVAKRRTPEAFDQLSSKVHFFPHSVAEERVWMEEHGPVTPALLNYLRANAAQYDAILFFSYRYWTTYHGLRVAPQKSLLVPTAEHDGAVHMRIFRETFSLPAAFAFNTPEERELLRDVAGREDLPGDVVGVGIEDARIVPAEEIRKRTDVLGDYVIYVGRIERNKGCDRLFDYFLRFVSEGFPHLSLALVGKGVLPVPSHPNILPMGFLSHGDKLSAIRASRLLVQPSPFESLSMVLLEAWKMERAALVNGKCQAMRGQVERAGGGLYYSSYEEFALALRYLLERPEVTERMGRSGKAYLEANYSWDVIMRKYDRLLAQIKGS